MEDPLHREILEEHARAPSFHGNLKVFNYSGHWLSRKTGNTCSVEIHETNSLVADIRFTGQGSALSLACASLMCSEVKGMSLLDALLLSQNIIKYIDDGKEFLLPGELIVYLTISRFPERHDCSLLGWRALMHSLSA